MDERFVGNDGPRFQRHIAGNLWSTSMNDRAHGIDFQACETNVNNNFPRRICEGREGRLHEGFSGGGEKLATMAQGTTYHFNVGPVVEHPPKVFKILDLVSFRGVDRLGASDMDVVGMQDIRNGREAHLFERPSEVADELDLLLSHWEGADELLQWTSVGIWG